MISCLWSGNVNFDGQIKYTGFSNDKDPILLKIGGVDTSITVSEYCGEDVNMDGFVKYTGTNNYII